MAKREKEVVWILALNGVQRWCRSLLEWPKSEPIPAHGKIVWGIYLVLGPVTPIVQWALNNMDNQEVDEIVLYLNHLPVTRTSIRGLSDQEWRDLILTPLGGGNYDPFGIFAEALKDP